MKDNKEIFEKMTDMFCTYQNETDNCESSVYQSYSPEELRKIFNFSISERGDSYENLLFSIKKYLELSPKTDHKQFFNQLFGGRNLPSIMGEMTASISNTSMYTYEMSPMATLMEQELIAKMCAYSGFENGDGIFTSGGSLSNLQAMLTARNNQFPDLIENGIQNCPKMIAFVSEYAHYSFDKAANILGLGTNQLVKVKTDNSGRMIPSELEKLISISLNKKEQPFFIGLTTGTTLKGAFDSIDEIAPIAKKYNIWLHADGSWGGSVILSKKHSHLISGIENVDSFTWNPHKLMNVSLSCSALLVKEKGILERSLANQNVDYLFHENKNAAYDLGKKSLQCGRRVDSLKLWLSWKFYGDIGYENRINKLFEMAYYFTNKIKIEKEVELMSEPAFLNICFRWIPNKDIDINRFNLELRETLLKSGLSMVNYGFIGKDLTIRLVITNPDIEKEDIDTLFYHMKKVAFDLNNRNLDKLIA